MNSSQFILNFVDLLFGVLNIAILARVLLSWFPAGQGTRLATIVFDITEPILAPVRKILPPAGMIDLSPMVAWILLIVAQNVIRQVLSYSVF